LTDEHDDDVVVVVGFGAVGREVGGRREVEGREDGLDVDFTTVTPLGGAFATAAAVACDCK
jgi:hypothetical protein